jgi:GDP-L-fucose synthase
MIWAWPAVVPRPSCIYPKLAPQPMKEDASSDRPPSRPTSGIAIAKIAGTSSLPGLSQSSGGADFISACRPISMVRAILRPASSHVVPALMRKIDEARVKGTSQVEIWGSGTPKREFLYVEDMADASVFLLKHYDGSDHVNIGTGVDLTIRELAETIAGVVGYRGDFVYDGGKPDGTPRKLMDVSRLAALGWRASTSLESGLKQSYDWFVAHRREVA